VASSWHKSKSYTTPAFWNKEEQCERKEKHKIILDGTSCMIDTCRPR
jgi:hypothetical protein